MIQCFFSPTIFVTWFCEENFGITKSQFERSRVLTVKKKNATKYTNIYYFFFFLGYVTSVAEFEGGVHLCCDILHRVLRTETPHDVLSEMGKHYKDNFKALAEKELLGQCVLTRYNNNLYRIDDIAWDKTPLSTFTLRNGQEMSFMEYYSKQYNLKISDTHQPLLVNKAKKHRKDEKPNLICLIPELCFMTGLTDKMRADFKVMKDIAAYTRVTPAQRNMGFKKFIQNLKEK